jgi:hypothetical protein
LADVPTQTQERTATRPASVELRPFDMRRKRPPALAFVLRMETLRRALRVISLLAIDFAGLFAALFVALMVKAVVRNGDWRGTARSSSRARWSPSRTW